MFNKELNRKIYSLESEIKYVNERYLEQERKLLALMSYLEVKFETRPQMLIVKGETQCTHNK